LAEKVTDHGDLGAAICENVTVAALHSGRESQDERREEPPPEPFRYSNAAVISAVVRAGMQFAQGRFLGVCLFSGAVLGCWVIYEMRLRR